MTRSLVSSMDGGGHGHAACASLRGGRRVGDDGERKFCAREISRQKVVGKDLAGNPCHTSSHHLPSVLPPKFENPKQFSRQNVYVSEFVEIVPGILCHPHHVIFASISV